MLSLKPATTRPNADDGTAGFGVYVHWPFCASKCPYCDFNSHVQDTIDQDAWRDAYVREIETYARRTGRKTVTSIFFGGGTPSLMPPSTVAAIIDTIAQHYDIAAQAEITLEANPTSTESGKFADFKTAGVNRVSLGIQSLRDADLKFLGRQHDAAEARRAIGIAADTFDRYSFDLIYARPHQTEKEWQAELEEAIGLAATHLSLYQLTIEEGTPFFPRWTRGEIVTPDDDHAGRLYELTQAITAQHGLPMYEVSNHARDGHQSRHNLTYWRYGDYAGIGPGAHGRLTEGNATRLATRAHRAPAIWLERVMRDGHGLAEESEIAPASQAHEYLMMGLRIHEGIRFDRLESLGGQAAETIIDMNRLAMMAQDGFIVMRGNTGFAATAAGMQRLNGVLAALIR